MRAVISQLQNEGQSLVWGEMKKLEKGPSKVCGRFAFGPIRQSALRQAVTRKILMLRFLDADGEEDFLRSIRIRSNKCCKRCAREAGLQKFPVDSSPRSIGPWRAKAPARQANECVFRPPRVPFHIPQGALL